MDPQIIWGFAAIALIAGGGVAWQRATPTSRRRAAAPPPIAPGRPRQAVFPCQDCGTLTHEVTRIREKHTGRVMRITCRSCSIRYRE